MKMRSQHWHNFSHDLQLPFWRPNKTQRTFMEVHYSVRKIWCVKMSGFPSFVSPWDPSPASTTTPEHKPASIIRTRHPLRGFTRVAHHTARSPVGYVRLSNLSITHHTRELSTANHWRAGMILDARRERGGVVILVRLMQPSLLHLGQACLCKVYGSVVVHFSHVEL
jgi:hypothetical protein